MSRTKPRWERGRTGVETSACPQYATNTAHSQNSVLGEMGPGASNGPPPLSGLCPVYDSEGNRPGQFRVVCRWHATTARRMRSAIDLCRTVHWSVPKLFIFRALLGAEPRARGATPFSSPDPLFTDRRRRYPRVGCRHDRMERAILVRHKLGRGLSLSILRYSQECRS
jgi:hypothetical protein